MKQIKTESVNVGGDPELFIKDGTRIIGSEKVLPKNGLDTEHFGKIIIDGIQAELNPLPSSCRVYLGRNISQCFHSLKNLLQDKPNLSLDFTTSVTVEEKEIQSLNPDNQVLGCMPSFSIYGAVGLGIADIRKFFDRSLGGHIHLSGGSPDADKAIRDYETMIKVMDILVGNTCVLIDRHEGNVARRKTYGRAGEYRKPKHGIEYRTLSSFWLLSYPLMSFVMGLSKQAVSLCVAGYADKLISLVNMSDIQKAINDNDFDLAMSNFNKIIGFICEVTPTGYGEGNAVAHTHDSEFSLHADNVSLFLHFVDSVKKNGLNYWFKQSPLEHWTTSPLSYGWEVFLSTKVANDIKR